MCSICPHCGFDLRQDEMVTTRDYDLDPRGILSFGGVGVPLTPTEFLVVSSLIKAAGRPISREAMIARINEDANAHMVSVLICRARRKIQETAQISPIQTIYGRGWRWAA